MCYLFLFYWFILNSFVYILTGWTYIFEISWVRIISSHIHTRTHTHTHTRTLMHTHSRTHTLMRTHSCTHTHAPAHTCKHFHVTHPRTLTHAITLVHTRSWMHTHARTLTHAHLWLHTWAAHSRTRTREHTHSQVHLLTHTRIILHVRFSFWFWSTNIGYILRNFFLHSRFLKITSCLFVYCLPQNKFVQKWNSSLRSKFCIYLLQLQVRDFRIFIFFRGSSYNNRTPR